MGSQSQPGPSKLIIFISLSLLLSACGPSPMGFTAKNTIPEDRSNPDLPTPIDAPADLDQPKPAPKPAPKLTPQPAPTEKPAPAKTGAVAKPAVVIPFKPGAGPRTTGLSPISEALWQKALLVPLPAWARRDQGTNWSSMTAKALTELAQPMLAAHLNDVADFCPKYNSLVKEERAKVWVMIFSMMAFFESSFKSNQPFAEGFKNSRGEVVISRGLLQISSESANSYGCGIQTEAQLEDPETNLRCGVRIMNSLVSRSNLIHGKLTSAVNGNPWAGGARYWSVLRWNQKDAVIRAATRRLPQC